MNKDLHNAPVYTQAQLESERDRMIEVVMKAIVADVSSEVCAGSAPGFVKALEVQIRYQERRFRLAKDAAKLALTELYVFFAELDIVLSEVLNDIEYGRPLDKSLVTKIKEAADAWERLGYTGI